MELVTGHAGNDHISAADMAALYRGILTDEDVVLATGDQLSCTMIDANTAEIGTGDCFLQAHHARISVAEQLEIRSGSNNFNRNDLIVARYTLGTGNVQVVYLAVIEGTAVAGDASDPSYTTGDIDSGSTLVEIPLWRIPIRGVNVGTPERIMPVIDTLQDQITALRETVPRSIVINGWTVTRLRDGQVQCEKIKDDSGGALTAWGPFYSANILYDNPYPFEFTEKPAFRVEFIDSGSDAMLLASYIYGSTAVTPRVYAIRGTQLSSYSIKFRCVAVGKTNADIGI